MDVDLVDLGAGFGAGVERSSSSKIEYRLLQRIVAELASVAWVRGGVEAAVVVFAADVDVPELIDADLLDLGVRVGFGTGVERPSKRVPIGAELTGVAWVRVGEEAAVDAVEAVAVGVHVPELFVPVSDSASRSRMS